MDELRKIEKRIFDKYVEWNKIDRDKALENTRVLDLIREACLIESYFSLYASKMSELFMEDIDATSIFTLETFEAYTHYYVLRKYLDIVDYKPITNEELVNLRKKIREVEYGNEVKELVNFMATEHFAANFFRDLSEMTTESILKDILVKLADQEVSHSQFAFDLLSIRLKKNPEIKDKILHYARGFQHVGAYVLPTVSKAKEDNLEVIKSFNNKVSDLVGESITDFLANKEKNDI